MESWFPPGVRACNEPALNLSDMDVCWQQGGCHHEDTAWLTGSAAVASPDLLSVTCNPAQYCSDFPADSPSSCIAGFALPLICCSNKSLPCYSIEEPAPVMLLRCVSKEQLQKGAGGDFLS